MSGSGKAYACAIQGKPRITIFGLLLCTPDLAYQCVEPPHGELVSGASSPSLLFGFHQGVFISVTESMGEGEKNFKFSVLFPSEASGCLLIFIQSYFCNLII